MNMDSTRWRVRVPRAMVIPAVFALGAVAAVGLRGYAGQPGTPVQRRATIAHGDGTSTTQVTAPPLVSVRKTTIGIAAEHSNN